MRLRWASQPKCGEASQALGVERGHAQETQARKGASDQTRAAQKFHESTGREMSRAEAYPERRRALVRSGPCLGTFGAL